MEYSTCRERVTKKKSESPTGIEPMTFRTPMLTTSLPVAQWLERPTGVRKVMGSIPVGNSGFFFVPRSRHVPGFKLNSYGRRAFSVAAPLLWNSLPQHVRDAESLDIFKRQLKTVLFKRAFLN